MRYFGIPTCPYCKKRVNLIRTWSLKRQGEYQCPRCGGISNIFLSPLIYVLALLAIFAGGAMYFFHKFVLEDIDIKTALYVVVPFVVFFLFSLFMVYLEKPVIKKISKEEYKRRRRQRQTLDEHQPQPTPTANISDSQEFIPIIRTNRALLDNTYDTGRHPVQQASAHTGERPRTAAPAQRDFQESGQIDLDSFSRAKQRAADQNLQHSQQLGRGVKPQPPEEATVHVDRPSPAAQTPAQGYGTAGHVPSTASRPQQQTARRTAAAQQATAQQRPQAPVQQAAQPKPQQKKEPLPTGASSQMIQALRDSGVYPPAKQEPANAQQVQADPATQTAARAETATRRQTPIQQTAYGQQGGSFRQQAAAIQQRNSAQQRASAYQSGGMAGGVQRPAAPVSTTAVHKAYGGTGVSPMAGGTAVPAQPAARQAPTGYQQYRSPAQGGAGMRSRAEGGETPRPAAPRQVPAGYQQYRSNYQQNGVPRRSARVENGVETPLNNDSVAERYRNQP